MSSWLRHSARKGLVTTRYPRAEATEEELPMLGRPPAVVGEPSSLRSAQALCPTAAITEAAIDQGRCIRCARCLGAGLAPAPPSAPNSGPRDALRWSGGRAPPAGSPGPAPLRELGRSIHVFLVDVGSCQACNQEVLALANPYYDASRLGIFFTNSPRHADLLVVVGVPTAAMAGPLRRTYDAMPGPKAVLAVGACAIDGGIFERAPGRSSRVDEIVPVDRYVAGCPPPPIAVLEGILQLAGRGGAPREG